MPVMLARAHTRVKRRFAVSPISWLPTRQSVIYRCARKVAPPR